MVKYEVDYLVPGALGQPSGPVIIASDDGSYNVRQLVDRAPPGTYGFSVFQVAGDNRQLVKTYYINAQLLDQATVAHQYGRRSYAFGYIVTSGCRYMLRLFDGRLLPFDSDVMEVVHR